MTTSPVWHPFTQHATAPAPQMISRTHGAFLETADGRSILDAISSWWVITHGHRHPRIMDAICKQAETLDQLIFAGFTHEPAEAVARSLVTLTAPLASDAGAEPLRHVFYSDSGSTSVEVALKMAVGYWHNIGKPRGRIIALEHAYHGDTIGTMSAGARGIFNAPYGPLLFDVARIPYPAPGQERETFDALDTLLRREPAAAVIVEPLVLGAGGMLVYTPESLREICRIARRHGALLIADEVMTGFGRTGTMFACEQAGISPDILCLAKGLTGGAIPLAATLATERIFQAHYSQDRTKTFFHSSSFTANPIACAAARANLAIWADEPVRERIQSLSAWQAEHTAQLRQHHRIAAARTCGTIAAFDLNVSDAGYLANVGPRIYEHALSKGVLFRPLGNTLYVMPPYCTTPGDLAHIYSVIDTTLARLS